MSYIQQDREPLSFEELHNYTQQVFDEDCRYRKKIKHNLEHIEKHMNDIRTTLSTNRQRLDKININIM